MHTIKIVIETSPTKVHIRGSVSNKFKCKKKMKISTNVMHNYSILPVTNFKTEKQNNGADQVLKKTNRIK